MQKDYSWKKEESSHKWHYPEFIFHYSFTNTSATNIALRKSRSARKMAPSE